MGEWAPLGPAADPVERPLVLVEGARVPRPQAKLTASQYIHTQNGGVGLNYSQSSNTAFNNSASVAVSCTWRKKKKMWLKVEDGARKWLSRNLRFGKNSRGWYACCAHVRKTTGSSKIFITGKKHVMYTNLNRDTWQTLGKTWTQEIWKHQKHHATNAFIVSKLSTWLQRQLAGFLWYLGLWVHLKKLENIARALHLWFNL